MRRLTGELEQDLSLFRDIFHAPRNADFIIRKVSPHGVNTAVMYLDGMANRTGVEDMILRPLLNMRPFGGVAPQERSRVLAQKVLPTSGTGALSDDADALAQYLLAAMGEC